VAYEGLEHYFPKNKIVVTGNPIRKFIKKSSIDAVNAKKHFNLNPQKTTLVVLGGSLGAKTINQLITEKLDWFLSLDIQIIWQCGSLYYKQYKELSCKEVNISAFVNEMDQLYASADIIISRAGAATLAELSCVAKPAILIPSPNVAENHQFHNAMALANQNAALIVTEKNLNKKFESAFKALLDKKKQKEVIHNLRQLAKPNAVKEIVNNIEELL
jgi:UDP-N-acetylglucosamine--N-acetylmuramyl-(pentapeptide) pyrophosphoryl-undecaprenol N-acetylglucosamine transferase